MDLINQKIEQLEQINVPLTKEDDFDAFWQDTMQKVTTVPLNMKIEKIDHPFSSADVSRLTYEGLDGTLINGWHLRPAGIEEPVPVVIVYHGAGGSAGKPSDHIRWVALGYAVIACDFRLQGGITGSESGFETGRLSDGWFALSVGARETSYLYHSQTDALRAVEAALTIPGIDKDRIAITGGSQGGATVLTVAALHPEVAAAMADVPSNCWFEKRIMDEAGGMGGTANYLKQHPDMIDEALKTFSYFDNINLAGRIFCPLLVSYGLRDPVCPPENVYAAYNRVPADKKEIIGYPFAGHEGGGAVHNEVKLKFIKKLFK